MGTEWECTGYELARERPDQALCRGLPEARELLTDEERRRLYLALAPDVDELPPEERAALEQAIEEGFEAFERGNYTDARVFAKQLLARP